jgi:lipoprotein-anchoring transpeptidase ErfK/SrfK
MHQNNRKSGYHSVHSGTVKSTRRRLFRSLLLVALIGLGVLGFMMLTKSDKVKVNQSHASASRSNVGSKTQASKAIAPTPTAATTNTAPAQPVAKPVTQPIASAQTSSNNPCSSNSLDKLILISVSGRHLWACNGATSAFDSPVITGINYLAADLTPPGTYHIYSKQINQVLKGSDSTGSWSDPVSYWMPFLSDQYGIYGFHDATWRAANDFGNISPDSSSASHGCVETPLSTAKLIYDWAPVGTTVTIVS